MYLHIVVLFYFDPSHSHICQMVKINRPSPQPIKFGLFHIIYGWEYPLLRLLSAQCLTSFLSLKVDISNPNLEPFDLQFVQYFPTNAAATAKETTSTFTIDICRPNIVLDGCQVGWMDALHEKLEAKDKFS